MVMENNNNSATDDAKVWGIDISLVEANLERNADERLEVLQQTLDTITALRKGWNSAERQDHPSKTSGK